MRRHTTHLPVLAAAARRRLQARWQGLLSSAPGQGLVEYGLILVFIMVVCVAVLSATGSTISDLWYDKLLGAFPS